jgi:GT2 family glycosyltransferase
MVAEKDVTIIMPHLGKSKEMRTAYMESSSSLVRTSKIPRLVAINGGLNEEFIRTVKDDQPIGEYVILLAAQGQCKAVNAAIATTDTPWIFVTNDDMVYPPGWFEKLVEDIGDKTCVSPKLIEPRPGAPTFEVYFCGGAGGDFDEQKWLEFAKSYRGTGWRTGFNLPFLIKRDLWDMVGGYDINYDPWGSNGDSDLEYKIKLAGVQPYQNTNSIVYHFSQTSGTFHPSKHTFWERNFAYFTEKWGFPRTDDGIWEATFDIPKPPIRKYVPKWEGKYGNK